LGKRIVSTLEKAGIKSIEDLKNKDPKELVKIKGLGKKALEEIEAVLK